VIWDSARYEPTDRRRFVEGILRQREPGRIRHSGGTPWAHGPLGRDADTLQPSRRGGRHPGHLPRSGEGGGGTQPETIGGWLAAHGVAALSNFLTVEAKAAAFTPSLLSSVVSTATGNGAGVSTKILQLAAKAATGTKAISITSLVILMKTKATLVAAILIALAAVGTTAYIVNAGNDSIAGSPELKQGADQRHLAGQPEANERQAREGKARESKTRERTPSFQSIEEAAQALIDFDLTPLFGSDREEAKRCSYRLRSLSAKIPRDYYSELTARFRSGSGKNLKDYFRQMALYVEWGRLDLEAALADLPQIDDAKMHSTALENVFRGSAEQDAMVTMKKAEILVIEAPHELSETQRISLMDAIFDTWIESDPFGAVEWAKQAQVPANSRDQWINDGLRTWSEKDPESAEIWRKQQNLEGMGR